MEKEQEQEQRQEITIEWLKAQSKELSDLKKMIFDLCYTYEDDSGDEYFPDKVIRKIKELMKEIKELKAKLENIENEAKKKRQVERDNPKYFPKSWGY